MRRQLDLRREETKTLHAKCDVLEAKLKELRSSAELISNFGSKRGMLDTVMTDLSVPPDTSENPTSVEQDDVRRWAEKVG